MRRRSQTLAFFIKENRAYLFSFSVNHNYDDKSSRQEKVKRILQVTT